MNKLLLLIMMVFRRIFSPILYWMFRITVFRGKLPNVWEDAKK